jgi:hypothetical protein
MSTIEQTKNNLHTVSRNYAQLQGHFQSFYDSASSLARQPYPLVGVTFEELTSGSHFKVKWCGRVLEFLFSVKLSDKHSALGVVTCVEPNIFGDRIEPREIDRYFFKPNGFVQVEAQSEFDDDMEIGYEYASYYIICRCFEKALQR